MWVESMATVPMMPVKVGPIELVQFWHPRIRDDDASKWLRKTIFELFRRD